MTQYSLRPVRPPSQRRMRAVGWGHQGMHGHRVYEALMPLCCSRCERTIQPGELLTRHAQQAQKGPVCRTCIPFPDPIEDGG